MKKPSSTPPTSPKPITSPASSRAAQKMISYSASPSEHFLLRTGAVCIEEGKVLLVRTKKRMKWFLPGGRNEFFEGLEEALKREIFEELKCDIQIKRLLWVHEFFADFPKEITHQMAFYFLCTIISPKDSSTGLSIIPTSYIDGESELEAAWIPLEEVAVMDESKIMPFLKARLQKIPTAAEYVFEPDFPSTTTRGNA